MAEDHFLPKLPVPDVHADPAGHVLAEIHNFPSGWGCNDLQAWQAIKNPRGRCLLWSDPRRRHRQGPNRVGLSPLIEQWDAHVPGLPVIEVIRQNGRRPPRPILIGGKPVLPILVPPE